MITEVPQYGLKAFALFFIKHRTKEEFKQNELDWIVTESMKKKIFSLLLNSGWIKKASRNTYICISPEKIIEGLLNFKVPEIIKKSEKPYAFTNLSAIEIWSDYCYVQRGIEKSPYFIKVLKEDLNYWKGFFNKYNIPNYISKGSTIGEYIILIPVAKINFEEKYKFRVEPLKETIKLAKTNEFYNYPYNYIKNKYKNVR